METYDDAALESDALKFARPKVYDNADNLSLYHLGVLNLYHVP